MCKKVFCVLTATALIAMMFSGCNFSSKSILINETNIPAFNSVSVTASSANIEFIESGQYGLEIFVPEEYAPKWDVSNGRLTILEKTQSSLVHIINTPGYYIKVYYPAGIEFNDVALKSASGDIKLPRFDASSLKITSASGKVIANSGKCDDVSIATTSGDIAFSGSGDNINISSSSGVVQSEAENYCAGVSIETASGDISLSGNCGSVNMASTSGTVISKTENCDAIYAETSSGDINLINNGTAAALLNITTRSGSIRADGDVWQEVTTESTSGDIAINGELRGNTSIATTSGIVEMSINGNPLEYGYELIPTSGSIKWNGKNMNKPAFLSGSFNNHISVNTTSGDIQVDFC